MIGFIGLWSHALAAVLFGALALWQLRYWNAEGRNLSLVGAFAVTSVWLTFVAILGPYHPMSGFAESARDLAFLGFMYGIVLSASDDGRQRGVKLVYGAVAGVIGLQITITGVFPEFAHDPAVRQSLASTADALGLTIAAGSLVLVHNLYGQASPDSRWSIRLPALALAVMWAYDLHLYTVAWLTQAPVEDLLAMRGAVLAMVVPLFALATRRDANWTIRLSRAATFQSLSLIAILAYLLLMMSATTALRIIGGHWVRSGQIGLILAMTVAALLLLPSRRARAWMRVMLAKHFFQHRYDYRGEWLRFTRTMASAGADATPLADRVVRALADIADARGGLLLMVDEHRRFIPSARWNWTHPVDGARIGEAELAAFLERTSHILDFRDVQGGVMTVHGGERVLVPSWMGECADAWAGIPLVHNDRLVGLVILAQPLVRRQLDWEDFDLFRAAGIQAASYLAEARTQEQLANAQRFDEFNRRFAFILHDIKNLVSQLSLVARNAERHADNPEFRADMIATLQGSVKKMNDLLARLSQGAGGDAQPQRPMPVRPVVAAIADMKGRLHPVEISGDPDVAALIDPARLEQALGHIVQNAIDASPPDVPVRIALRNEGAGIAVEVIDSGPGMTPDFIRTRLFQPFASTKDGGYGIGAFEARALVAAMGGRIEVESREGEGSRFTVFLPAAETAAEPQAVRMRA